MPRSLGRSFKKESQRSPPLVTGTVPSPSGHRYVPFDFKKESKRKGGDVLQTVERIAARMVEMTGSWLKMASTLFDDTTPSARLVPPGARAAPTHPRAQPGQLGSLRWPLLARLRLLRR